MKISQITDGSEPQPVLKGDPRKWGEGIYVGAKYANAFVIVKNNNVVFFTANGRMQLGDTSLYDGYVRLLTGHGVQILI